MGVMMLKSILRFSTCILLLSAVACGSEEKKRDPAQIPEKQEGMKTAPGPGSLPKPD